MKLHHLPTRLLGPVDWRGRIEASGWLFDPHLVGVAEARARVLAAWCPGATLVRSPVGWWLRLPEPVAAMPPHPGVPVLPLGDAWTSLPDVQVDGARVPRGSLVYALGGEVDAFTPKLSDRLDPSSWMALALPVHRAVTVPPVSTMPEAPAAPVPPALEPEGSERFQRDALEAYTRKLQQAVRDQEQSEQDAAPRPTAEGFWSKLRRGLGFAPQPEPPSMVHRRVFEELAEILRMFEEGRTEEALKRAPPVHDRGSGIERQLQQLLSRLPDPRESLTPDLGPKKPKSSARLPMGKSAFGAFQDAYRRSAEELAREGRYEEAAFVLADLLGQPSEAILLLERSEQYELAAQLAEHREVAPSWQVALWWQPGYLARAVEIAVREQAFDTAIRRLETADHPFSELRIAWGQREAQAGRWEAAVLSCWKGIELGPDARGMASVHPALRTQVLAWTRRGIEGGGPSAARLTPNLLWLSDDAERQIDTLVAGAVAEDGRVGARTRHALARSLSRCSHDEVQPRWLGQLGLGLLADVDEHAAMLEPATVRKALRVGGYEDIVTDMPLGWPSQASRGGTVRLSGSGTLPVVDVLPRPDGGALVASGHRGLTWLAPDGTREGYVDLPAHALVANLAGGVALVVSAFGEVAEVHRVDLATREVAHWTTVSVTTWSRVFDGSRWVVAHGSRVWVVDAVARGWRLLRSDIDLGARVVEVVDGAQGIWAVVDSPALVRLDRATCKLLVRQPVESPVVLAQRTPVHLAEDGGLRMKAESERWTVELVGVDRLEGPIGVTDSHLVLQTQGHAGQRVQLVPKHGGSRLTVACDGATRTVARVGAGGLVAMGDDLGRVAVLDGPSLLMEGRT